MKLESPSALRNRDEILVELRRALPTRGTLLEVASGVGIHCCFFAPHFPSLRWQPTDRDPERLASIRAYAAERVIDNLAAPLELDTTWETWPVEQAAAMVNINMIHASPWEATLGLFAGARRTLSPGGLLFVYGAYKRHGHTTAPSNLAFDARLKERDPRWGVRQLEDVVAAAEAAGLRLEEVRAVPNNNCVVLYRQP
jgi:hypothetical protein